MSNLPECKISADEHEILTSAIRAYASPELRPLVIQTTLDQLKDQLKSGHMSVPWKYMSVKWNNELVQKYLIMLYNCKTKLSNNTDTENMVK